MKRFFVFFSVLVLAFSIMFENAKTYAAEVSIRIDNTALVKEDGTEIEGNTNVNQYDNMIYKIGFTITNGSARQGDTSTIQISDTLTFPNLDNFEVWDSSKQNKIADAIVDGDQKTIKLVYTSYVQSNSDITGELQFFTRIDQRVTTSSKKVQISYSLNSTVKHTLEVNYRKNADSPDEVMSKYQWFGDSTSSEYTSIIRINPSAKSYSNVTIKDELRTTGTTYDPDSFVIRKGVWEMTAAGTWDLLNYVDVTANYQIIFNQENNKFFIDFGALTPNDQFRIAYKVQTNRNPVSGEFFSNYVEMLDENVVIEDRQVNTAYTIGGGTAEGYTFSVKVIKVDTDGNPIGSGMIEDDRAQFKLVRKKSNIEFNGTVNQNGELIFSNLLRDDYTLIETRAPKGYQKSHQEFDIASTSLSANSAFVIQVENPGLIELSGEKTWSDDNNRDGKRPSEITVNLLANGTKVNSTSVRADGNGDWKYTFTDLPVYENGTVISYSVSEETVSGYTPTITGYDILNTYTPETTDISGEKTWSDDNNRDGKRPSEITVNLLANGTKVNSTSVRANGNGDWKYTFTDLPVYENGTVISYSVSEETVSGYTPTITGYDILNSKNSTDISIPDTFSISGIKKWQDDNNRLGLRPKTIIVNLLADGTVVDIVEVKENENGIWSYSFSSLPMFKDGKSIKYEIIEEPVKNYTSTIINFDITNTIVVETPVEELPSTGIAPNFTAHYSILIGIVSLITSAFSKKVRHNKI